MTLLRNRKLGDMHVPKAIHNVLALPPLFVMSILRFRPRCRMEMEGHP